jgi:hypothetical protein
MSFELATLSNEGKLYCYLALSILVFGWCDSFYLCATAVYLADVCIDIFQ